MQVILKSKKPERPITAYYKDTALEAYEKIKKRIEDKYEHGQVGVVSFKDVVNRALAGMEEIFEDELQTIEWLVEGK